MRNQRERALALMAVFVATLLVFASSPGIWIHAASDPYVPWQWQFPDWLGGPRMQKAVAMFGGIAAPALGALLAFLALRNADSEIEADRKKAESLIWNALFYAVLMTLLAAFFMAANLWRIVE